MGVDKKKCIKDTLVETKEGSAKELTETGIHKDNGCNGKTYQGIVEITVRNR